MEWIEARVYAPQIVDRSKEQAATRQKNQRQGHLQNLENALSSLMTTCKVAPAVLQPRLQVRFRTL